MFRKIKKVELGEEVAFDRLLTAVVSVSMGNGGFNPSEVRQAVKILDEIEGAAEREHIVVTESEYHFIKRRLDGFQFTQAGKPLVLFLDAIDNATAVDQVD